MKTRRDRPRKWAAWAGRWRPLKTAWQDLQVRFAVFFVLLYLATQLPLVKEWLASVGVSQAWLNVGVILPIILTLVLWQTVEITRRLDDVEHGSEVIPSDDDALTALAAVMANARTSKEMRLDVVGISLTSTWPLVRRWVDNGRFDGWHFRFAATTSAVNPSCPPRWGTEGSETLAKIAKYGAATRITERRIQVAAYGYQHVPVIHGFRTGSGDVFMTTLTWSMSAGKPPQLRSYPAAYEHIHPSDDSAYARERRRVFDAWCDAAFADGPVGVGVTVGQP